MEFGWDENKNEQNKEKHGLAFEEAKTIFEGRVFSVVDRRKEYGEIREISIGALNGIVMVVVVHTQRSRKIRIISARLAKTKERRMYNEYFQKKAS